MIRETSTAVAIVAFAIGAPFPAKADAMSELMSLIPPGYQAGACRPAPYQVAGATAIVECGENFRYRDPLHARYMLFKSRNALDSELDYETHNPGFTNTYCPGLGTTEATNWTYTDGSVGGQIACGITQPYRSSPTVSNATVIWTNWARTWLGEAYSGSISGLYHWVMATPHVAG